MKIAECTKPLELRARDYVMSTNTRRTKLDFTIGANPMLQDGGETFTDPYTTLRLRHEATQSLALSFGAEYRRTKVSDQSIGFDEVGTPITYTGFGERALAKVSAGIEGGIGAPFGYKLNLSHTDLTYSGADLGTDYYDRTTDTVSGGLRFDLSAMTSLTLDGSHSHYEADNANRLQRDTDRLSFGVNQRLDAATMLGFSAGYSRVDVSSLTRDETTKGATFGASLMRDDTRGRYGLSYDRSIGENGARDTFSLSRTTETRLGELDAMIGLSQGESGTTDVIGSLAYSAELPRDKFGVSLVRAVQTDDDGEDVVSTRLRGTYGHQLNDRDGLNFGLGVSSTEAQASDKLRLDASVAYERSLTADTSLSAGVRMAVSQQSNREDATSQSVFVSLTRQMDFLR